MADLAINDLMTPTRTCSTQTTCRPRSLPMRFGLPASQVERSDRRIDDAWRIVHKRSTHIREADLDEPVAIALLGTMKTEATMTPIPRTLEST